MDEIENVEMPPLVDRRSLLPIWIKVFIWIFMIMGAVVPLGIVLGLLGAEFKIALYGLETEQPFSATGLFLMPLIFYKGITAFCLWTRKDMGIVLGEIDAIVGMAVCGFVMLVFPLIDDVPGFRISIRAEILLLIPYLIKLQRIKQAWKEAKPNG